VEKLQKFEIKKKLYSAKFFPFQILMSGNFFFYLENDDMTENSDSGFTEINQKSNGSSPSAKSSSSPQPIVKPEESSHQSSHLVPPQQQSSTENNCPSDEDDSDDDDYEDSDTGKPDLLSWVS
jgi:hypothetical protein